MEARRRPSASSRHLLLRHFALLELPLEEIAEERDGAGVDEEVPDGLAEVRRVVPALQRGGETGEDDDQTDERAGAEAAEGVQLEEPEGFLRLRLEFGDALVASETLHVLRHRLVLRRPAEHLHVRVLQHHAELELVVVHRGGEVRLDVVVLLKLGVGARAVIQRRARPSSVGVPKFSSAAVKLATAWSYLRIWKHARPLLTASAAEALGPLGVS